MPHTASIMNCPYRFSLAYVAGDNLWIVNDNSESNQQDLHNTRQGTETSCKTSTAAQLSTTTLTETHMIKQPRRSTTWHKTLVLHAACSCVCHTHAHECQSAYVCLDFILVRYSLKRSRPASECRLPPSKIENTKASQSRPTVRGPDRTHTARRS